MIAEVMTWTEVANRAITGAVVLGVLWFITKLILGFFTIYKIR